MGYTTLGQRRFSRDWKGVKELRRPVGDAAIAPGIVGGVGSQDRCLQSVHACPCCIRNGGLCCNIFLVKMGGIMENLP